MVAFITNINPIITRNTILMEINDITSAPEGPVKLELIETTSDIFTTSKFTYRSKGQHPALRLTDRAHKQIPFKIMGKPCVSDRDGMIMHRI